MPEPKPNVRATCSAETVSRIALDAATRSYGRDELALVPALREPQVPGLCAMPRNAPPDRLRRRLAPIAAGLITAAAATALGAYAILLARAPGFPARSPAPRAAASAAPPPEARVAPARPDPIAPVTVTPARPSPPPAPESRADPARGPSPSALIELLATARYREALAGYEQLARAEPNQPAYAAVTAVLQQKLNEHCAQRAVSGGSPCPATAP